MRRQMRRRGIVPLAFAVALTVAAGLSLAEEHAWVPAGEPEGAITSDWSHEGAKLDGRGADRNPSIMGGQEQNEHRQAGRNMGVGSRALTGHNEEGPSADERTR